MDERHEMMESIVKLREHRSNPFSDYIADEIEREIAEKYIMLPIDFEGKPIRLGDTLRDSLNEYEFRVDGMEKWRNRSDWIVFEDMGPAIPANRCYHVEKRTLEDVLTDFGEAWIDREEDSESKDLLAEYACEIRELVGGEE